MVTVGEHLNLISVAHFQQGFAVAMNMYSVVPPDGKQVIAFLSMLTLSLGSEVPCFVTLVTLTLLHLLMLTKFYHIFKICP